jgi:hypothetical protein
MADDTTPAAAPAPRPAPPLPSGFRPVETPAAPAPRPAPPLPSGFRPVESEARRLVEGDSFLSRTADRVAGAVDVATDIGEGILSGGVNFVQGIAELPAIGFDAAFDTNTARAVTDFFEPARDFVQPEGTAGRVAADLTTFGAAFIPLAGWLSRASQSARLAKAGKAAQRTVAGKGPLSSFMRSADNFGSSSTGQRLLSTRFGQYGTTALATGAFTALVSPDGRATLSDSFDAFPEVLKTEADTGLQGREEALRRVRNRLRQGAEDAIISGAFDTTLSALGAGARQLAQVPQVAAAANTFNSALAQSGAAVTRRFPKAVAVAQEYFTPSGGAEPRLFAETEDAKSVIRTAQSEAQTAADDYTSALNDVMKAVDLSTKNRLQSRQFYGEVNRYLEGASDTLPSITDTTLRKKVTDSLDRMITVNNNHIDRLMFQMESVAKNPALDETQRQRMAQEAFDVLKQTRSAQGTHLRRAFEIHTNPVKFYKNLDLTSPLAKKAQQEVAQNLAAMEGRDALDEAVQQRAKNIVFNSLGLGDLAVTKGVSEERLVKEALDRAIKANRGEGKLGSLIAKDRAEFVTDKSLFTPQEETLTKSPALRELLGEVADPIERFVRTTEDVTRAFVAEEFYTALPRLNLERNLMDGLADLNAGLRPAVISAPDLRAMTDEQYAEAILPFSREAAQINADEARLMPGLDTAPRPTVDRLTKEKLVERYEQRLTEKFGYIKLGEADATDVFGGLYGSASGKYVSPETYRAITQPLRLQHGVLSEVLGTLSGLRNFTQKMSIVPNPAAQIRNIFGNLGFLAGNANLPTGANVTDLLYTFVANTKELDDAGLQRLAKKLELSGVAESNLVLQALKDYQNAADDLTFSGKMNELLNSAEGVIPFMRAFEALYSNTDTFFKGASLLAEEGKIANALSRAKVGEYNPDLLQSFITNGLLVRPYSQTIGRELSPIELMAAEVVKDTMPIYNRVVKAVRVLDAIPVVGNFTSFAAENIRNSIGTVMRGIREAGYEAGPVLRQRIGDQAANTLEQEIRAIGIQRLMGYTTMAYVIPKTLVKMSMQATNTSPEQMAALYEMNPDYLDGHDLVILENNREDGYIDYVDLSYVMPYAFMTDAAQAAIREFQEKGRADASTLSSATQGVWRGFQMFADPFAAETLFYERLRNVMPAEFLFGRGGVSATGAEIYGPNQSMADKALASFNHLMAGLTPNVATMLVEEQNGELREGRLLRAYTGTPDRQGETTNPSKEIARLVTGFTPMRLNMRTDARYKGSEYLPLRTDSLTRALRGLKDAAATPESVVADWEAYLDELYRAQSSLYRSVEAMRTLGMNDSEIRYALVNQAGLGRAEAGGIIDGRFSPGIPSVETAANIRDQLNREGRTRLLEEIDFGRLNDMSAARKDEPLRTAPEQRPEVLGPRPSRAPTAAPPLPPGFSPVAPSRQPLPAPPLPPGFRPLAPAPTMAPPMPQGFAPQRQGAVNPALLGETPAEQAANAQIAQRTGQA